MVKPIICKVCMIEKGLKEEDVSFTNEDDFLEHYIKVHCGIDEEE